MADRTVATRLIANNSNFDRAYLRSKAIASDFAKQLDSSSDRMSNLVQTGLALGPALVPTLAAGGAAAVALGSGLAAAATGMGVAALAFQGVGDALEAVNAYQLDPTVENLEKAREALRQMSPAGAEFVGFLQKLRPKMQELQNIAQEGLLPGVQEGISDLMSSFPTFERIVGNLSSAMGELSADAGEALSGPFWDDFFDFIATEGPQAIDTFGRAFGNLITGFAGVAKAFGPLGQDISDTILDLSRDFAQWGTTLDSNEGFQGFIDYVRSVGPQAFDTLGALANALIQLVQAAAPVGQAVLPVIELLANGLSAIADSPAGPVLIGLAAGLSAISRAIALYNVANGSALMSLIGPGLGNIGRSVGDIRGASTAFLDYGAALDNFGGKAGKAADTSARLRSSLLGIGKAGAGIAGVTLLLSDFDDQMSLSNTATLGLLGTLGGAKFGALGAAAGLVLDLAQANDDLSDSVKTANTILSDQPSAFAEQDDALAKVREEYEKLVDAVGDHSLRGNPFNDLDNVKDMVEGWFGSSDVEEAANAMEEIEDRITRTREAISDLSEAFDRDAIDPTDYEALNQTVEDLGPAFQSVGMDVNEYVNTIAKGGPAAIAAAAQFDIFRDRIEGFQAAQDSMSGRSQGVLDALAGLDDKLLSTAASAEALEAALESLLGPGLNLSEARDAWVTSLRTLREELSKHSRTLVGNSNAALQNREAIRGRVQSMVDVLNAEAAAGAGSEKLSRIFVRQRGALLDAAAAAGVSRKELRGYLRALGFTPKLVNTIIRNNAEERRQAVQGYINTLDNAPRSLVTEISQPGFEASHANIQRLAEKYNMTPKEVRTVIRALDQASGILGSVKAALAALDGDTATTYVNTVYSESRANKVEDQLNRADGGIVDYYANGGTRERHVAQIAPAGAYRVWAEEETGGESYIPLAPSKRQRSLDIWMETGRRLGVEGFARGDVRGGNKPLGDKFVNQIVRDLRDQFGKQSPIVDAIERWLQRIDKADFSQRELNHRIRELSRNRADPILRQFRVGPRQDASETRSEVRELVSSLRETYGPDSRVARMAQRRGEHLMDVARRQDKAAAKHERAVDKFDRIQDRQRDFMQSVRQAFTHDAFGDDVESRRESLTQLRADANDAARVTRQFRTLGRKGLDDAIIRQLAQSGNYALIQDLARSSRGEVNRYEAAFRRRNRNLRQLGRVTGRQVFGDELHAQRRVVARTERTLRHVNRTMNRLPNQMERAVVRGVRHGFNDRNRRQRGRRRAKSVR